MRIRVNYARPFEICYLGHLDLMRTIERGLRRSKLPLKYTEGFNKRVKLEMGFPLSVGVIGEDEYMDFYLEEPLNVDDVMSSLLNAFSGILEIKRIREVTEKAKSITSFDAVLAHVIESEMKEELPLNTVAEIFDKIYYSKKIEVIRENERKEVRRFIDKVFPLEVNGKNIRILLSTYYTRMGSIRILEFAEILNQFGLNVEFGIIRRFSTLVFSKANLVSPFDVDY